MVVLQEFLVIDRPRDGATTTAFTGILIFILSSILAGAATGIIIITIFTVRPKYGVVVLVLPKQLATVDVVRHQNGLPFSQLQRIFRRLWIRWWWLGRQIQEFG